MESMVISALYTEVSENTAKVHNSRVTGGSYSLASASRCNTFPSQADTAASHHIQVFPATSATSHIIPTTHLLLSDSSVAS